MVFDSYAALKAYKNLGEWQTYEVETQGDRVSVKVNGILVTRAYQIAPAAGYLVLQCGHGEVDYRSIQIKEDRPMQKSPPGIRPED